MTEEIQDQPNIDQQAIEDLENPESIPEAPTGDTQSVQQEEPTATQEAQQMVTLKRGGQEVQRPLSEVIKLAQQGEDYTQKTQRLAEEREAIRDAQQFQYWMDAHPDQYSQIQQIMAGGQANATQQTEDEYADPEVKFLKSEVAQLKSQMSNTYNYLSRQESEAHMKEIENNPKYGDLFKDPETKNMIVAHASASFGLKDAYGKPITPKTLPQAAEEIFAVFNKRMASSKMATEKKVIEGIQNKSKTVVPGTGTMETSKPFNPSKASRDEIDKEAIARLTQ